LSWKNRQRTKYWRNKKSRKREWKKWKSS